MIACTKRLLSHLFIILSREKCDYIHLRKIEINEFYNTMQTFLTIVR